jgi:hypothetical protein
VHCSSREFTTAERRQWKVAEVMASVGMTGAPEISVIESIDAPGTVA